MLKTLTAQVTRIALVCCATATAYANPNAAKHLDVSGGELIVALEALSKQAAVDLVFQPDQLKSLRTEGVRGVYSPREAIRILIKGTQLQLHTDASSGAMIIAVPPSKSAAPKLVPLSATEGGRMQFGETRSFWHRLRLAQVDTTPSASDATQNASEAVANETPLDEVVITGTSIRGQDAPVGSQLIEISSDDIAAVAPQTTRDILATIPQFGQFNVAPTPNIFFNEAPNARGLGVGTLLTMLNGRRLVGFGLVTTAADPSVVPVSAIESIQLVPDGSSAIYGSDAVAGVINLKTRQDFSGMRLSGRAGFAEGFSTRNIGALLGDTWSSGSVMLAYDYSKNTTLLGRGRDFVTDDLRPFGGPDLRSTNAPMPNVIVNGVSYAYPALLPNTTNYLDTSQTRSLVPANERHNAMLTLRHDISERVRFFADLLYSKNTAVTDWPLNFFNSFTFTMTDANPFFRAPPGTNARAQQVRYSFARDFGETFPLINVSSGQSVSTGLEVELGGRWRAELSAIYGRSRTQMDQVVLDLGTATAAAAGTTEATAFDPFTGLTNPAILEKIRDTLYIDRTRHELTEFTLIADGPLFSLAGRELRAAVGAQRRLEWFSPTTQKGPTDTTPETTVSVDRTVNAAFGELLVPLFTTDDARPGLRRLDFSAALRYEDYDSFGGTTNPKFGLNWEPLQGLRVRLSKGTSFKAPQLTDIQSVANAVQFLPQISTPNLVPPGQTLNVINLIGGNPNLGPQTADTRSAGVDLALPAVKGFSASITYSEIEYSNVIGPAMNRFANPNLAFTYVLNPTEAQIDAAIAGLPIAGVRFAPGQSGIIVDSRSQNLRTLDLKALDYEVAQRWTTSFGSFHARVGGTTFLDYGSAAAPGVAQNDSLRQGTVKTKLRGSVDWRRGAFLGGMAANYTGKYMNVGVTPAQQVDSFLTLDLNAAWTISSSNRLNNITVALYVDNVLDEDPPCYLAGGALAGDGWDPAQSNPLGRMFAVSVAKSF